MKKEAIVITPKLTVKECIFGDQSFYHKLIFLVVPMIVQNTLSNVVGLLDNVMIGRVGTVPMSAVAIVNQLIFVFYICIWGGTSGAGIFTSQFFGKGDTEGVKSTFQIKMLFAAVLTTICIGIFLLFGMNLVSLYIAKDTAADVVASTLGYSKSYLMIMLIGLIPFSVTTCYSGTIRESGKTFLPMVSSITAMIVNFVFNLILIFGYLGFPALGVKGAAIATVISRFVEMAIVVICGHLDHKSYPFMEGIYRGIQIPGQLLKDVLVKAAPLLTNECLWAVGESVVLQAYSTRGIDGIAAMNINYTVAQIFNEVFLSLGSAAGILVGQELGANRFREAVRTSWRIISSSVFSCLIMGVLLVIASPFIPLLYNTEPEIRLLATELLIVSAIVMPLRGMTHASYFTLRSGGKTWITLIFDSCYSWILMVPVAYIIAYLTNLSLVPFYAIVAGLELLKIIMAIVLLNRKTWVKNIVQY